VDDSTVARAVEEIRGASIVFGIVLVLGPVWSFVVTFAGWGFPAWALGAAVWRFLLFRAVQNVQSLRCPRCGRPWRAPLSEVARRDWPTQRRCRVCGFRVDDY
jgi:DNA-directed RNA polymerase subunit RPC12/RpoP